MSKTLECTGHITIVLWETFIVWTYNQILILMLKIMHRLKS